MDGLEKLGSVQFKVSCVFKTVVVEEGSKKRKYQTFKVIASSELKPEIIEQHESLKTAIISEKLDGTCCLIQNWQGKPWLWARLDRKLNKLSERKFRKVKILHREWEKNGRTGEEPTFTWTDADFKDVPSCWQPASGVKIENGIAQADINGHIPGWIPVSPGSRQYCWHLTPVDFKLQIALLLRENEHGLEIVAVPLDSICGHTVELIGTNINGNPYGIGSRDAPIHMFVVHGSISNIKIPELNREVLNEWFTSTQDGAIEGVVWHCEDGTLFKVHRHHLELPWPVESPRLCQIPVYINVPFDTSENMWEDNSLFRRLNSVHQQKFQNLSALNV
ncbi:RNA ligase 1-like [Tubulanus polymorphus]|uniref:RNA ligase 1-like n=1 Tax=Tubulanus polymorphus TaxID=672921 RepID=UPI003DA2A7C5